MKSLRPHDAAFKNTSCCITYAASVRNSCTSHDRPSPRLSSQTSFNRGSIDVVGENSVAHFEVSVQPNVGRKERVRKGLVYVAALIFPSALTRVLVEIRDADC